MTFLHRMCYTEGAVDFWLQGIQPIEILSRIPTSSSSSVIYKQKFKNIRHEITLP